MSYGLRRIFALVVVSLAAASGGLLAEALADSRPVTVVGVVVGAVVGMVFIVTWINVSSR